MELRHLRYFVAVAEEQNITKAAARLHVSQPPLSRQIRDLEEELGLALLERGAKAVKLTEAGRVFLVEAQAVLTRADQARAAVWAFAERGLAELHVGYAPSLTVELLPHALREFQKTSPGIRVVLHDLSTEEMLTGLRDRQLDLALTIQPEKAGLQGLVFVELRRFAVRVAVHEAHPWLFIEPANPGAPLPQRKRGKPVGRGLPAVAGPGRVTLPMLAGERLVGYSKRDYPEYHEWLARLFVPLRHPLQEVEEHDSATSLIAAVESGRGVALVPESFACFAGQRLRLLPLEPAPADFAVGLVHRKEPVPAALEAFTAAARQPAPTSRRQPA